VNYLRFLARRVSFAALSAYLTVTATFAVVSLTPNPDLGAKISRAARFERASAAELERIRQRYVEARGLDESLLDRYVGWLVDVTTLDWGYSFSHQQPVWDVLAARVPTTMAYVVPGILLAVVLGVVVGLFASLSRDSVFDRLTRAGSYALLGVPTFVGLVWYTRATDAQVVLISGTASVTPAVDPRIVAALAVAAALLAGQVRFSRAACLEEAGEEFVKLVRAKGGGFRTVGRHVLRVTVLPILSLFLSELLGLLLLSIIALEMVFSVPGYGRFLLSAAAGGEPQPVMAAAIVTVGLAIGSRLLEDLAYVVLEPRDDGQLRLQRRLRSHQGTPPVTATATPSATAAAPA